MKYLDNIYKQSDISWFTPVEIFKVTIPHDKFFLVLSIYSDMIQNVILIVVSLGERKLLKIIYLLKFIVFINVHPLMEYYLVKFNLSHI
jgi:hypothetical protein